MLNAEMKKVDPNATLKLKPIVDRLTEHCGTLEKMEVEAAGDISSLIMRAARLVEAFVGPEVSEGSAIDKPREAQPQNICDLIDVIDSRTGDLNASVKAGLTELEMTMKRLEGMIIGEVDIHAGAILNHRTGG